MKQAAMRDRRRGHLPQRTWWIAVRDASLLQSDAIRGDEVVIVSDPGVGHTHRRTLTDGIVGVLMRTSMTA